MANIDEIANAIGANKKAVPAIKSWFGKAISSSPLVVAPLGYRPRENEQEQGVECTALCKANVGNYVYVVEDTNGHCTAVGVVGGEESPVKVLYNNSSGTSGTANLSQSAANFNHMRIYFKYNTDSVYSSETVYSPNGKYVQLSINETSGANGWLMGKMVVVSGTTVYNNGNWYGEGRINNDYDWSNVNTINIVRVEGWNL